MRYSNDDIGKIRTSFERIQKGLTSKLKNGDEKLVTDELGWIDDKINSLFKLRESNFTKFKLLIDPNNQYEFKEPIDLSSINWSEVKIIRGNTSSSSASEFIRDVRKFNFELLTIYKYDLLDTFISFAIKVWSVSNAARSYESARRGLYLIGNLYSNIALQNDARLDFFRLFRAFVDKLTFQAQQLVLGKNYDENNNSLIRYLCYQFHLIHLEDEKFPENNFEAVKNGMLLSLKACIENNQIHIVENFIRTLTDGSFVPLPTNNYSELYSFIDDKYRDGNVEDRSLLKKIPELGFWRAYYAFSKEEYTNLILEQEGLMQKLCVQIQNPDDQKTIIDHFAELKLYALRRYKYRLMQRTLISVLVYALFKKEHGLVDFAFNYNQPSDAAATWSNKDIVPVDLTEILTVIGQRYSFDDDLLFQMPDHHGALGYIDLFFMKAILNWVRHQRTDNAEELKNMVISFASREEMKRNPGVLEGLISTVKDLSQKAEVLFKLSKYPFDQDSDKGIKEGDQGIKDRVISLINGITAGLKEGLEKIERRTEIREERIEHFVSRVLLQFQQRAFFRKVINERPNRQITGDSPKLQLPISYTVGYNELIDRSIFLENWHVPTFGIIEFIGNQFAEQENFYLERALDKMFGEGIKIKGKDINDLIRNFGSGHVIIFKNYMAEYQLAKEPDFIPKWKSDEFSDRAEVIGKFRESIVYEYRAHGLDKLLTTNQHLGLIEKTQSDKYKDYKSVQDFYVKTIDLGTNDGERKKFIAEPPSWLTESYKTEAEQENFLSKKIWLRIYGTFMWSVPEEFSGQKFIIEETNY